MMMALRDEKDIDYRNAEADFRCNVARHTLGLTS